MTIKVIDSVSASQILAGRSGSGMILSALNLFMLGFLKDHSRFPKHTLFWCDGLMGSMYLRAKGVKIEQLRGVEMLKAILEAHKGKNVNVLGSCSENAFTRLKYMNLVVSRHFSLDAFDLESFEAASLVLNSEVVIITLPSPKQELLAMKLAALPSNAAVHFYCIGGALNMLANPEFDCPRVLQKLGFEFLFRLRTDTRRRLRRLLSSASMAFRNISYLRRQCIKVVLD